MTLTLTLTLTVTQVVVLSRKYDETRLWWLLTAHGKRHVYILDGGYGAYVGAGLPTTLEEPTPCTRGTWTATPLDESMLATREQTLASRDLRDGVRLWDVRTNPNPNPHPHPHPNPNPNPSPTPTPTPRCEHRHVPRRLYQAARGARQAVRC